MGMVVKNNMSAVRTLNTLNSNTAALQKSLAKVSSGMKINSAQDDASGYAISERMRVRIRSLDQANQNSQNDSSLMKTAEGAVGNTVEILRALKEKAINAANDSNTDEDRQTIQKEINQFIDQIDDNALVQFNGKYLIDGSKNNVTNSAGTKTILLNQSLATDTAGDSKLTALANRANDKLGIQSTDKYQVSWVQNGTVHTASGTVGNTDLKTLLDLAGVDSAAVGSTGLIAGAAVDTSDLKNQSLEDQGYKNTALTFDTSANNRHNLTAGSSKDDAAEKAVTELKNLKIYKTAGDESTAYTKDDLLNTTITAPSGYSVKATNKDPNGNESTQTAALTIAYNTDSTRFYIDGKNTGVSPATNLSGATNLYYKEVSAAGGTLEAPDKFGKAVYTPDKTQGVAVAAKSAGVDAQLSGLTINILDQDGNVKKAADAALDQFKQYQRAENATGDMALNFHIGSEANVAFKVGMGDMRAQALGLKGADGTRIDVYTKEHANAAINVIENALTKALDQQTTIGAIEARLEYTSTNLTTSSENVQAAESTIRDADMAKEMTNYTKSNVLLQAAQAMLAQANQNSSAVLSLLQ